MTSSAIKVSLAVTLMLGFLMGCQTQQIQRANVDAPGLGCVLVAVGDLVGKPNVLSNVNRTVGMGFRKADAAEQPFSVGYAPKSLMMEGNRFETPESHGMISPRFVTPGDYRLDGFSLNLTGYVGAGTRYRPNQVPDIRFTVAADRCTYVGRFVISDQRPILIWQDREKADLQTADTLLPARFKLLEPTKVPRQSFGGLIEAEK